MTISMTKQERLLGWIFLVAQLLLIPVLVSSANEFFHLELGTAQLNFIMFFVNFAIAAFIFRKFLLGNGRLALQNPWHTLRWAGIGFLLYYGATILHGFLFAFVAPGFSNANDESIRAMAREHFALIAIGTILLVPITEECLYRGLIFGTLRKKSKLLAYIVSTAAFSALHVVSYIGTLSPMELVLSFAQYLPAGAALALAYDKADSIWASILIHMTVNQIGILSLR